MSKKELSITIRLSKLEREVFRIKTNHEIQRLLITGEICYPYQNSKILTCSVTLKFESPGVVKESDFTKSTDPMYSECDRLGVVYIKEGGLSHAELTDLYLFAEVSREFLTKVLKSLETKMAPKLYLELLVDQIFLSNTYEEPTTVEAKTPIELDQINISEKVTCAIIALSI